MCKPAAQAYKIYYQSSNVYISINREILNKRTKHKHGAILLRTFREYSPFCRAVGFEFTT